MADAALEIRGVPPSTLAGMHSVWKKAVARCDPWVEVHAQQEQRWTSRTCTPVAPVVICHQCDSTMNKIRELIEKKEVSSWSSVLAAEQSSGRGQRDRTWISPPGNLYAAWHWPPLQEQLLPLAPYVIALGVSKTLEDMGLEVQFKWPNDILIQGRKTAGILITQSGGESIVGVGINLTWAPEDRLMQIQGAPNATHLAEQGLITDPIELWMEITRRTRNVFERSPRDILNSVEKRLAWMAQCVMIRTFENDSPYRAVLLGLAEDGALIVQRENRKLHLYSASLAPEKGE